MQSITIPLTLAQIKRLEQALVHSRDTMEGKEEYGGFTRNALLTSDQPLDEKLALARSVMEAHERATRLQRELDTRLQRELASAPGTS